VKLQQAVVFSIASTVNAVASDGPTHCSAVDAQLMGAAGERLERQPGASGDGAEAPKTGLGGNPVAVDFHPPAAAGVARCERQVDETNLLQWPIFDNRPIGFLDLPTSEQVAQSFQCFAVAAEDQTARRVFIEAVGERRIARQSKAKTGEMILQTIASLGAAVDRNPIGFVQNQHQSVAVQEAFDKLVRMHQPPDIEDCDAAKDRPSIQPTLPL
jgi:hypothetical protein